MAPHLIFSAHSVDFAACACGRCSTWRASHRPSAWSPKPVCSSFWLSSW